MSDDFNLYPLHVFRLVAQKGSVTGAAQQLYISQPAVSAHLRALEQRLGEPLFERTPRGVLLTPAGQIVLDQANKLFALYEELPFAVSAVRGRVQGEVTVAASSTPGAYCVPALLKRFQELYPEARPRMIVGDSAEVLEWLREYRVPLGVVGEMSMTESLHCVEVGADELRLVVAAKDPLVHIRQLKKEHLKTRALFIREQGSSTRAGAETLLGELLKEFGRVIELSSTEAIKQAVIAGLGVAVLSSWATQLEEQTGLLHPVRDARLSQPRRFYLARRQDRVLTGTALALWDCLTNCEAVDQSKALRSCGKKTKDAA
jgi:molybdate transport repressor ModE-like protein